MIVSCLQESVLSIGRYALKAYRAGPDNWFLYSDDGSELIREKGFHVALIAAAIESGITLKEDIISTVADVANAMPDDIELVMIEYHGTDPTSCFWRCNGKGHFALLHRPQPTKRQARLFGWLKSLGTQVQ